MNEVTRIHLGRQAFTVSVDAHKQLKTYLDAIKRHVGTKHKEVLDEVELRMAELLLEKGITGEKVVMARDVEYLQEHLGSPSDFEDEDDESTDTAGTQPRRLFRDTENQILGGVAAGLGRFFGIDPLIPRLLFLLLTFAGGSGVMLYVVLWLLVPPAKSKGDYLRMEGKPITVDALRDFVDGDELKAGARRAGNQLSLAASDMLRRLIRLAGIAVGVGLIIAAIFGILWTIGVGTYMLLSPDKLFDAGPIFPVGMQETVLLALIIAVLLSGFSLLTGAGVALVRRKWPLPIWISAVLAVVFLVGSAVGVGLGAEVGPRIRDRYEAAHRSETRQLAEFKSLEVTGDEAVVIYEPSDRFELELRTVGNVNTQALKAEVKDNKLYLEAGNLRDRTSCSWFCISTEDAVLVVRAPRLDKVTVRDEAAFKVNSQLNQENLSIQAYRSAELRLAYMHPAKTILSTDGTNATLELLGLRAAAAGDLIRNNDKGGYTISRTDELSLNLPQLCDLYEPHVYVYEMPAKLTVNGREFADGNHLYAAQSGDEVLDVNCVVVR